MPRGDGTKELLKLAYQTETGLEKLDQHGRSVGGKKLSHHICQQEVPEWGVRFSWYVWYLQICMQGLSTTVLYPVTDNNLVDKTNTRLQCFHSIWVYRPMIEASVAGRLEEVVGIYWVGKWTSAKRLHFNTSYLTKEQSGTISFTCVPMKPRLYKCLTPGLQQKY